MLLSNASIVATRDPHERAQFRETMRPSPAASLRNHDGPGGGCSSSSFRGPPCGIRVPHHGRRPKNPVMEFLAVIISGTADSPPKVGRRAQPPLDPRGRGGRPAPLRPQSAVLQKGAHLPRRRRSRASADAVEREADAVQRGAIAYMLNSLRNLLGDDDALLPETCVAAIAALGPSISGQTRTSWPTWRRTRRP